MNDPVSRPVSFVGLVADDLTGAADSAVQFAAAGWDARLVRHQSALHAPGQSSPSRLDALTSSARAASYDQAALATRTAVDALVGAGIDRLFVKVDSTVRGSVAGQLVGALAAWRHRHPDAVAVICPAFPDHGRTVSAATVLVHGVPLAHTAAAQDPVTPVTTSAVAALFPGSVPVASAAAVDPSRGDSWVVDATSNEDLAEIAAIIERLGPRAVAVGSGGLAQALAAGWAGGRTIPRRPADCVPARSILVAVSSVHPVAKEQLEQLRQRLSGPAGSNAEPDSAAVVVVATPDGTLSPEESVGAAAAMARQVASELRRHRYDTLVLIGGDGALAVLDELGADQLTITDNLIPGTPHGTILGGSAHGMQIVTRSGGFGDPDQLLDVVDRLRHPAHRPSVRFPSPAPFDPASRRN